MTIDEYMEAPEATSDDGLFRLPLAGMTAHELVSARSRIDTELKRRDGELSRDRALVRRALGLVEKKTVAENEDRSPSGKRRRSDLGSTRPKKAQASGAEG